MNEEENKIGRCVDCEEFRQTNPNVKESSCNVKKGYITKNALNRTYCNEYKEKAKLKRPLEIQWCLKDKYFLIAIIIFILSAFTVTLAKSQDLFYSIIFILICSFTIIITLSFLDLLQALSKRKLHKTQCQRCKHDCKEEGDLTYYCIRFRIKR